MDLLPNELQICMIYQYFTLLDIINYSISHNTIISKKMIFLKIINKYNNTNLLTRIKFIRSNYNKLKLYLIKNDNTKIYKHFNFIENITEKNVVLKIDSEIFKLLNIHCWNQIGEKEDTEIDENIKNIHLNLLHSKLKSIRQFIIYSDNNITDFVGQFDHTMWYGNLQFLISY